MNKSEAVAKKYSFTAVEIEINHDCNRSCAYCPNSILERPNQGRMPEPLFVRIMEQLQAIGYAGRVSYHFYNEPLISPDLDRFVQLTKSYLPGSWIEIFTNGMLLTEVRVHELLELGVDKFTVTQHHTYQGDTRYAFAEVHRSLAPETKAKIKFQNYRNLVFTNRGGLLKNLGYCKKPTPLVLPCLIPSMVLVVTVNGNVVPCYEDYLEQNQMGNVTDQSLPEIWDSPKYRAFRESLRKGARAAFPVCRDCNCVMIIS